MRSNNAIITTEQQHVCIMSIFFLTSLWLIRVRQRFQTKNSTIPFVEVVRVNLSTSYVRVGDSQLPFQLTLPPDTIEPLFSGAAWAGTVVWPASLYLANYLARERVFIRNDGGEQTVIELGSGVGIPGVVSGILGAKRVILTEQPPLSELLDRNIRSLFPSARNYEVITLDWRQPVPSTIDHVDLILISDCIYEGLYGESWRDLATVLNLLLTKENRALNCVERRKEDGVDRFIEFSFQFYGIQSSLISSMITPDGRMTELYELRKQRF